MIRPIQYIALILALVLLLGCKSDKNQVIRFFDEPQDTIRLNLSKQFGQNRLITSHSSKWYDIETTRDAKLQLDTGLIAILDNVLGTPYLDLYHGETGERLESLEDENLLDISLCQQTNRMALLYKDNTVEIRDYQLKIISAHRLKGVVTEISLNTNSLIVGKWPKDQGSEGYIVTERLDLQKDISTPLLFVEPHLKSKYRRVKAYTATYKSGAVFAPFFSNSLFYSNLNGTKQGYALDFGKHQPDISLIAKSSKDPYFFAEKNDWLYGIDQVLSTHQYTYLKGLVGNRIFQLVLDHGTHSLKIASLRNDIPISHTLGNQFVGLQRRTIEELTTQDITNYNQLKINRYEVAY